MEGSPKWNGPFPHHRSRYAMDRGEIHVVLAAAHKEGVEYDKLNPRSPLYNAEVANPRSSE